MMITGITIHPTTITVDSLIEGLDIIEDKGCSNPISCLLELRAYGVTKFNAGLWAVEYVIRLAK